MEMTIHAILGHAKEPLFLHYNVAQILEMDEALQEIKSE